MRILLLSVMTVLFALPASAQKPGSDQKRPQPVIVTQARLGQFEDRIEALGTLRANETITVTATVTEPVTAVNFDDGQRVKAGDILVEMMSKEEEAELNAAQATLSEAQRQVERIAPLVKGGAASKSVLDQRQRELDTARAALDSVKSRISDRVITAPFDGILGLRHISVGAVLQTGTVITTLDDDSRMKLDFSVPSVFLSALKAGLEIEAKSNAYPGRIFKGKITSIDSQVNTETRSIMVRAVLPNEEYVLRPGLLMSVEILKNPRQALVIPEEALVPVGHQNYVFTLEEAGEGFTAKRHEVTLGTRRPGEVEIMDGLSEDEKVITHGTLSISDGDAVTIRAEQTGKEAISELIKEPEATPPALQNSVQSK